MREAGDGGIRPEGVLREARGFACRADAESRLSEPDNPTEGGIMCKVILDYGDKALRPESKRRRVEEAKRLLLTGLSAWDLQRQWISLSVIDEAQAELEQSSACRLSD